MEPLFEAVIDLVELVSPGRVRNVARAVRAKTNQDIMPSSHQLVATPTARSLVERLFAAWRGSECTGDELAGMLVGAAETKHRVEQEFNVELVWTGPTTRFVPTRRTDQVLLELIEGARNNLFLVSFVAYSIPSVAAALNSASSRGVSVRFLLEASLEQGGSLNIDPIANVRATVPEAEIFTWTRRSGPFADGKVHAKLALSDIKSVFVTSANLTGYALERNMEAGVLISGGRVPRTLKEHLDSLIHTGVIQRADKT